MEETTTSQSQSHLPPLFKAAGRSQKSEQDKNRPDPWLRPSNSHHDVVDETERGLDPRPQAERHRQPLQLPPGFIQESPEAVTYQPPVVYPMPIYGQPVNNFYSYPAPRPLHPSQAPQPSDQFPPISGLPMLNTNGSEGGFIKDLTSSARIGFIRKVYAILGIQILITTILTIATFVSEDLRIFMVTYPTIFYVAIVGFIITLYALACYPKVARSVPINYILLAIFTICMAYVVAVISSMYSYRTVTAAAILTLLMAVGLTAYAWYTKTDFTMLGGMLFVCSLLLVGAILLGIFITSRWYHALIAAGIVALMSIYIIYDTQLIIGKHSQKFMIDDYIFAALSLYLDIINIFLALLQLIGLSSSR